MLNLSDFDHWAIGPLRILPVSPRDAVMDIRAPLPPLDALLPGSSEGRETLLASITAKGDCWLLGLALDPARIRGALFAGERIDCIKIIYHVVSLMSSVFRRQRRQAEIICDTAPREYLCS
jgi:hypothetical protein